LQQETPAAQLEAALTGALGPEAQQQAIDQFIQSPGQQFLRGEQEQALLRNQSAIGGLGGGRVRSALQEQALGRAATFQQQSIENLRNIASRERGTQADIANIFTGQGQAIAGQRAGLGVNLANITTGQGAAQAAAIQNAGQAQAAGTLGIGSAIQQGIGGLSNFAGGLGAQQITPQQQIIQNRFPAGVVV
jgi:hypothetical protein